MPTESILVSIAVCGVFLLFAAVLAWVDHHTTSWQHSGSEQRTASAPEPPREKAA